MSISSGLMSIYGGFAMPMLAQIVMMCEISQLFNHLRTAYFGKDNTSMMAILNGLMFLFSYTLVRVINFPLITYALFKSVKYY